MKHTIESLKLSSGVPIKTTDVNVEVQFQGILFDDSVDVLVLLVSGQTGIGCEGNGDSYFIESMATAGLEAWNPRGIVFDFRKFAYQWGDLIGRAISLCSYTSDSGQFLPIAIVTSELCDAGLRSLLSDDLFEDPNLWLFSSIEQAVTAIRQSEDYI